MRALWDRACHGDMQVVLITGEAGIGKSRLVQEFTGHFMAQNREAQAAVWPCRAQAVGRGLPFSSLFQVLRVAIEGLSAELRGLFAEKYPYLSMVFPELGKRMVFYPARQGLERTWLFETLRRFIVDVTELKPAVLWMDDLPEADEDTLDWLQYFLRHTERCRMLFIGTCRTQGMSTDHSNDKEFLAAWMRQPQVHHIALRPLQVAEADALITSFFGHKVDEDVRRYVLDQAVGVPLFILEMLRMVADRVELRRSNGLADIQELFKKNVPLQVAAIISARMNDMPRLERTIMRLLAVSDNALPWAILAQLTGVPEDELTTALSNLVRADLIMETGPSHNIEYTFRHPLYQVAVSQQLSSIEIRHIHKALAVAWRGDVVRSAYHVRMAGNLVDAQEAIPVLYHAGQHYISLRAYQSARECLEHAWELAHAPFVSIANEQKIDIQLALAEVYMYLDRTTEAIALLEALYMNETENNKRIRIKRMLVWSNSRRSPEESMRHIEEGLTCWDGVTANDDVFWMLKERIDNSTNVGNVMLARTYLGELRDYVEKFPNDRNRILLKTHEVVIDVVDWKPRPWEEHDRERWLHRALAMGDPEAVYEVCCVFGYYSLNVGDFSTAIRYASECVKWMRRFGMVQHEISIRLMHVCGLFMAGRWREALCEAQDVKNLAVDHDAAIAVLCALDFLAMLFALQGHWEDSRACTKESLQVAERIWPTHPAIQIGQTVKPAEAVWMLVGQPLQFERPVPVVWANTHGLPVFLTLLQGLLHMRLGATEFVSRSVTDLRRAAGTRRPNYFQGAADFLGGLLAKQEGDTARALEWMKTSYDTFMALGTPLESAMAQLSWAYMARHRYPRQAAIEAEQSRMRFEGIGATTLAKYAQTLLTPLRLGLEVQSPLNELSAREFEIVQCVARGLSNKQIAETLLISPRTVSTHLEKIYKKLDVHSRTELLSKFNRS
ncbi:hypothetical protein GCM10010885_23090 [Alicyclobacillus cellulosilyticus]|uniref:HTH luxR-type domain-containing protein n=1 Tax=Alicyclobacillus cellulosilyticus TaxID=1003997 RepID=A0A917NN72_9BACL|nr:hypothetical protein GCM10010885_23090 [Alicyclobacillus cellulosilyticus]